jgi:hypothetical protein
VGGSRLIADGAPNDLLLKVDLAVLAASFGLRLREHGLAVTPEMEGRFARAVSTARPLTVSDLALIGRTTLTCGHDQAELFQLVFQQVFGGLTDPAESRGDPGSPQLPAPVSRRSASPGGGSEPKGRPDLRPAQDRGQDGEELLVGMLGAGERLGKKDFSECTPEETGQILELIRRLPLSLLRRQSRRRRQSRSGNELDVRATLRRAHRTGADPVELVLRHHVPKSRRLVMLADISGSMEPYTRVYLNLFYGAVRATRAECFVFATRLTRLTDELAGSDPDQALRRAGERAPDWSGGTLIGQAVEEFNDRYGRRGMARGAVVVIVSDGWEGGDPVQLGRQMRRLSLLAHRVVWVNPRSARTSFQPTTAGMAAALPHVHTMVSGHSLEALQTLLLAIGGESRSRPLNRGS